MLQKIFNKVHYHRWLKSSKVNATFIVSTGRTGTKFFETFFKEIDKDTYVVHEPQPDLFDLSMNKLRKEEWASSEKVQAQIEWERGNVLKKLSESRYKKYIESNPFLSILLNDLKAVYEEAKFVIITREPKSYVKSVLNKSPLDDGRNNVYGEDDGRLRLNPFDFENDPYQSQWEKFSRVEKIAWYWNKCNLILLDFLKKNMKCTIHLKFEDLFSKDENIRLNSFQTILDFLNYDVSSSTLSKLIEISKEKKNETKIILERGYDEWTNKEKQMFDKLTQEALIKINKL